MLNRRSSSVWHEFVRIWFLLLLLCSSLQSIFGATINFNPTRSSVTTMYTNEVKVFTVTLSSPPSSGTLSLTIDRPTGSGTVTKADGSTPCVLQWPQGSSISNQFRIVAPASTGSGTFRYTITGTSASSYTTLPNNVITWIGRSSFTVGSITPSPLYTKWTSNAISVTPSATVVGSTTISFSASGTTTMTFLPTSLTWSSGSSGAKTFTILESSNFGSFPITFSISGTGSAQFNAINSVNAVIAQQTGAFTLATLPSIMYVGNAYPITVTPNSTPSPTITLGITVTGGSVSSSSLTFTTTGSRTLTISAGSSPGTLQLTFTTSGTDAPRFVTPTAAPISVRAKQIVTTTFDPPTSAHTKFYTSQTLAFEITNDLGTDMVASLGVTVTGTINGVNQFSRLFTFTSSQLSFSFSDYTAPSSWTGGQTSLVISFALSGPDQPSFVVPSSVTFSLATRSSISITYAEKIAVGTSTAIQMKPAMQPPSSAGVTLTFSIVGAASSSPSSLTFTSSNYNTLQSLTVVAPSDFGTITVSITLSGTSAVAYTQPSDFNISILAGFFLTSASISELSSIYAWPNEPPVAIEIYASPSTPPGAGGVMLNMTTSTNRAVAAQGTLFPPSSADSQVMWYRQHTSTGTESINFAVTDGTDSALILPPSSVFVTVVSYPSNSWGNNPPKTCTCSSGGTASCSTGWWGTGECTCKAGFTGTTCNACLPGFYSSTCKACGCVYGTCAQGISGSGACSCQPNWSGTTCTSASNSKLLPKVATATCIQDSQALVPFSATITSPAWGTTISTLPSTGTLYTTTDGSTRGTAITSVPYTIPSKAPMQKVIYVPPDGAGLTPNAGAFDTFQYQVFSSSQSNTANYAVVTLIVNKLNEAPVVDLDASLNPDAPPGSHPTAGTVFGRQNEPLSLNLFTVSDPDAVDGTKLLLTLNVPTGTLGFSFPRTFNPSYLSFVTPAPSTILDFSYASSSITIDAKPEVISSLVACLFYNPVTDFAGFETLTIELKDRGASGVTATGSVDTTGFTVQSLINMYIQRVNKPIRIVPSSSFASTLATAKEDDILSLPVLLTDADSGASTSIELRVYASHGTFRSGTTSFINGEPMIGSLQSLNSLLANLTYHPDLYYYGSEVLVINVTDAEYTVLGGASVDVRSFPFTIEYVNYPPVADSRLVEIHEDRSSVITLSGRSLDDNTTSTLNYRISSLPDPNCMVLYQWNNSTRRRGVLLTTSDLITSSTNQVFARMVYGSRSTVADTNGCPFTFITEKLSGPISSPGVISFNVTDLQNHPPVAQSQTVFATADVDTLITMRATDADGDNVTYWLASLPADPLAKLYTATKIGLNRYTRGTLITNLGVSIIEGKLFYWSDPSSVVTSDNFTFGSIDRPWRSYGPQSNARVDIVIAPVTEIPCPNLTVTANVGAPFVGVNFQDLALSATGRGISEIRLETDLPASAGAMYYMAIDEDGEPTLGDQVYAGSYLTLDPTVSATSQLLQLYYKPPTSSYGSPLGSFLYSCTSLQNVPSPTLGSVTVFVNRVDRPPDTLDDLTFASVPFPAGLTDLTVLTNATDADIIAGTAVFPEGGGSQLSVKILRLPQYGTLRQYSGAAITGPLPVVLTDQPLNRFQYIPTSSLTPPFYDTFIYSVSDQLLDSQASSCHMVVGAASMPPSLSTSLANFTLYEGGDAMKQLLTINITEPKHLGGVVKIYANRLPMQGYIQNLAGKSIHAGGELIDSTTGSFIQIYYVPPLTRLFTVPQDNFTLFAVDSLNTRSVTPDLRIYANIVRLNQPPVGYDSYAVGDQDSPIKFTFNFTTFGLLEDATISLKSLPDPDTQGSLYECSPFPGVSMSVPTNMSRVNSTTVRLKLGCDGNPETVGLVFVPVRFFYTMKLSINPTDQSQSLVRSTPSVEIEFVVNDGAILSSLVTSKVSLDFKHVIYPPWAFPVRNVTVDRRRTQEGAESELLLFLQGEDYEDANILTAQINSLPTNGKLYQVTDSETRGDEIVAPTNVVNADGKVIYVPELYFHGGDSFMFQVQQLSLPGAQSSIAVSAEIVVDYVAIPPFFDSLDVVYVNASQNQIKLIRLPGLRIITNPDPIGLNYSISKLPLLGSLYQVLPSYDSTSGVEFNITLHLGEVLLQIPSTVTHPEGLVAFMPELDALGDKTKDYYYSAIAYGARSGGLETENTIEIKINVLPQYRPPRVAELTKLLTVQENIVIEFALTGIVDTNFADVNYDVLITRLPSRGRLCQILDGNLGGRTVSAIDAPCGTAYGSQMIVPGARLTDKIFHRLAYLPPLNEYGVGLDSFEYKIRDSRPTTSVAAGQVSIDVTFVNQPPYITPSAVLLYKLEFDAATSSEQMVMDLTAAVADPDNSHEELTYTLWNLPQLGEVQEVLNTTTMVGSRLSANGSSVEFPYTLPSPYLLFHPRGSGGSPNPYSILRFSVSDPAGLSTTGQLTIESDCGTQYFPNIWTVGENKGPLCLKCPYGALCSSQGLFKPVSQAGFWRSSILNANGGPIYIQCKVPSSCLSAPYEAGSLLVDPSLSNSNASSLQQDNDGCAPGFGGRMCASCDPHYYFKVKDCLPCPSQDPNENTLKLVALLIQIAIPLVTIGLALLWLLKKRLKVDLSFVTILLTFFQVVSTFKGFDLNWPLANGSIFDKLSFVGFDFDVLSLECSIPELAFTSKWLSFMLLPVVAAGVLSVGSICGAVACVSWQYFRLKYRRNKYDSEGKSDGEDHNPPVERVQSIGDKYSLPSSTPPPPADGDAFPQERKVKSRPKTFLGLCAKWFVKLGAHAFGLFIMFCDFIYLPLTSKAMNMLACTRQADGTFSLDYQPSLRCDEPWWTTWSQVGIFCLIIYGIGIPVLYMYIFFHLRPQVRTYPPSFIPRRWWYLGQDELDPHARPWCLCPRNCNRRAWKKDILRNKTRERVNLASDEHLQEYIHLQVWSKTFQTLVQPFRVSKFYWSILVITRSFLISLCGSFMLNAPTYQCAAILFVLGCALTLQLNYHPYKFHIKYNLNSLETTSLISQAIILTCGMIFYLASKDNPELLDDNIPDSAFRYPVFRLFMQFIIYSVMLLVMVVALVIFVIQFQFRLQYDVVWRHSRARVVMREWMDKVDHFVATKMKLKSAPYLVAENPSTVALAKDNKGQHGQDFHASPAAATRTALGSDVDVETGGEQDVATHRFAHKSILTGRQSVIDSTPGSTLEEDLDEHVIDFSRRPASVSGYHAVASPFVKAVGVIVELLQSPVNPSAGGGAQSVFAPSREGFLTAEPMEGQKPSDLEAAAKEEAKEADGKKNAVHHPTVITGSTLDLLDSTPTRGIADTPTRAINDTPTRGEGRETPSRETDATPPTIDNKPYHNRLKSTVWQPPRLSVTSPLRGLDARSMFTHARYVSLNDFSLRQIMEINENAALLEQGQQGSNEDEYDETKTYEGMTASMLANSPSPVNVSQARGAGTPLHMNHHSLSRATPSMLSPGTANPADILRTLRPKAIPGVDLARASYGRFFKPPPPAGLFMKRVAVAATHLAALKDLFGHGRHGESSSDDDDNSPSHSDSEVDDPVKFTAYQAQVKKHRHKRNITFLVGKVRFKEVVKRLIIQRSLAKRLNLRPDQVDPETGVPLTVIDPTRAVAKDSPLPGRVPRARPKAPIALRPGAPSQPRMPSRPVVPTRGLPISMKPPAPISVGAGKADLLNDHVQKKVPASLAPPRVPVKLPLTPPNIAAPAAVRPSVPNVLPPKLPPPPSIAKAKPPATIAPSAAKAEAAPVVASSSASAFSPVPKNANLPPPPARLQAKSLIAIRGASPPASSSPLSTDKKRPGSFSTAATTLLSAAKLSAGKDSPTAGSVNQTAKKRRGPIGGAPAPGSISVSSTPRGSVLAEGRPGSSKPPANLPLIKPRGLVNRSPRPSGVTRSSFTVQLEGSPAIEPLNMADVLLRTPSDVTLGP